jgi:predicted DNA-binding transcriptional regulator YafY
LGIVFMDFNNCLLAWCLLRQDFRVFRLDRMLTLDVTDQSFRPHRFALLRDQLDLIRAGDGPLAADRKPLD